MKHTFPSGITGESFDPVGDEFLRGMIHQRDPNAELALLRKQVSAYETDQRRGVLMIAALVHKAGGEVSIDDIDEMQAFDLIVYRDESKMATVLKTKPRTQ